MPDYLVIATWPFGRTAVEAAAPQLEAGRPALDAAIAGAQAVEDDPKVNSVGYGAIGNSVGTVQLDACVMDGRTLTCGAVAGVENIGNPAALARLVMEKTPHILLVGEGAKNFGIQNGFPLKNLNTPESVAEWERRRAREKQSRRDSPDELPFSHDTVAVLARDQKGSLGGACSTSGLAFKLPGRVGDSPLIGHGLYVDNEAGAAGATGVGEEIIRVGGSLLIVEAMRAGLGAQEACERAVRKVNQLAVRRGVHPAKVAFLAIDAKGNPGAACTMTTNFDYAIGRPGSIKVIRAKEIPVENK